MLTPEQYTQLYPNYRRDPIHELEMSRALLSQAELRGAPEALINGLKSEIEWWKERAVRAVKGKER